MSWSIVHLSSSYSLPVMTPLSLSLWHFDNWSSNSLLKDTFDGERSCSSTFFTGDFSELWLRLRPMNAFPFESNVPTFLIAPVYTSHQHVSPLNLQSIYQCQIILSAQLSMKQILQQQTDSYPSVSTYENMPTVIYSFFSCVYWTKLPHLHLYLSTASFPLIHAQVQYNQCPP